MTLTRPLACLLAVGATLACAAGAQARSNVVVVMTDDETVEELGWMPRTRALLGSGGVTFKRSYVSYPVCCPSRATYLTGRYPHNHRVLGLSAPTGGYGRLDKANTVASWLQRTGYHTGHIGKFLNGYGDETPADVPPGWSEWAGSVDPFTYRMWGYRLNENGIFRTYGSQFFEDPEQYQTDVYTRKAVDFIERNAGRKPFFLSLAYLAPHHETQDTRIVTGRTVRAAPRHSGTYANVTLRNRPSYDEADISDKPAFRRRLTPPLTQQREQTIRLERIARLESLRAVDEGVQQVVAALDRRGVLGNTYILFTSDNGFMHGEHRVPSGKLLPYEESSRVPLLIRGPRLPRGRVSGELVTNEDLAPTLLDLSGASPSKPVDGRSLLPYARKPRKRSKRYLLTETGGVRPSLIENDGGPPVIQPVPVLTYRGVRTPRYKWIEYRNGSRELYDLAKDPYELRSVHRNPRYRLVRRALAREAKRLARCAGRTCRVAGKPVPAPLRAKAKLNRPRR